MLMASGANFGLVRTIPHMFGVALGFVAMVVLVGLGLIGLFDAVPISYTILKVMSIAYLLYLAWKIANAAPPDGAKAEAKPLTFVQAAAFQWVNPKAWTMALSAIKQGDVETSKSLLREAIDTHPQHFEAAVRSLRALENS